MHFNSVISEFDGITNMIIDIIASINVFVFTVKGTYSILNACQTYIGC